MKLCVYLNTEYIKSYNEMITEWINTD